MILHPRAALRQRLGMSEQLLDLRSRRVAQKTLLHRQDDLRHDLQIAIHEHVERVRNYPFGGILDRDNSVICAILAHLTEHVSNGFLGGISEAGTETADGGLMGES